MSNEQLMNEDRLDTHLQFDNINNSQGSTHLNSLASTSISNPPCKKSCRFLSAFVKHTKLKTNKSKLNKQENLQLTSSSSTNSNPSGEELEVMLKNLEKQIGHKVKCTKSKIPVKLTGSVLSVQSPNKVKNKFLSKFLLKHEMNEDEKRNSDNMLSLEGDPQNTQNTGNVGRAKELSKVGYQGDIPLSSLSVVKFEKPTLPTSLVQGLLTLQNLVSQLQQREKYLMQIFQRFVDDVSLQQELADILGAHSKIQMESERVANNLSMEMWSKQLGKMEKTQENTIHDALSSVIKQNRQLLSEYKALFLTYEELLGKFLSFKENNLNMACTLVAGSETEIQEVIRHNFDLLNQIECFCTQLEYFEFEITSYRSKNENLEAQLTCVSGQLHDLKEVFHQTKDEYELQLTTLNNRLQKKEKLLSDGVDACENFQKELSAVKDELMDISFTVNWSKLKCNEEGICNLLELGRICLSKLTKEIIHLRSQVGFKQRDIETLVETNEKLQKSLKKSTIEFENLTKRIDDRDKALYEYNYKLLESKLKISTEQNDKLKFEFDMKKGSLLKKIQHYEDLQKENHVILEQSKLYINSLKCENEILRNQMEGLNKMLIEKNPSQVFPDIDKHEEKPVITQAQYNQILLEKQHVMDQFEHLKQEHQNILSSQKMNFQSQQDESAHLLSENKLLLEKLELEKKTLLSLQNEKDKYLEERSLLKVVFEHMKKEINRLQKSERTVEEINKEAKKLAIIADYNKEISKKLKSEIAEKDKIIGKLRTSVEELNDIQLKNTKEKLSLCFELSELTHIKESLDKELVKELEKNAVLDGVRNKLVQSANSQIKQFEQSQRQDRTAFKDLLKDLKVITKQRNLLFSEKDEAIKELENTKKQCEEYRKEIDDLYVINKENERKLKDFEKKYTENNFKVSRLQEKVIVEVEKYDENISQLEKLIVELRKEKLALEDSIKYLQNNLNKLHKDLNESKSNEKDLKDSLNNCVTEKTALEEKAINSDKTIEALTTERDNLMDELQQLNTFCEKILTDFETNLQSSIQKKEAISKELSESSSLLFSCRVKNDELEKQLSETEAQLLRIKEDSFNLQILKADYDKIKSNLQVSKENYEALVKQMESAIQHNQSEMKNYVQEIENLKKENEQLQNQKQNMSIAEINVELADKLRKLESSNHDLTEMYEEVSRNLIKSMKTATEEKETRIKVDAQLREARAQLNGYQIERVDLQEKVNDLLNRLSETKNQMHILMKEKETGHGSQGDLQRRYGEVVKTCILLEREIRQLKENACNKQELKATKEECERLKHELQEQQKVINCFKQDITSYQQKLLGIEFQKSELTIRLHEIQRKYDSEHNSCAQLKNLQKVVLNTILKLKQSGMVNSEQCDCLINLIQQSSTDEGESSN